MRSRGKSLRGTAFQLLAVRDRSCHEMENSLLKRGFSQDDVRAFLVELKDRGYLDDRRLAERMAQQGVTGGKTGPVRMRYELVERGIPPHLAQAAVQKAWQDVDEQETAQDLAAKKVDSSMKSEDEMVRAKGRVGRYLLRRGFTTATVHRVIDKIFQDEETDGY